VPWTFWTAATVLWFAAWIALGSRHTAAREGDAFVVPIATLLRAFAVTSCMAVVVFPHRQELGPPILLWAHHAAFALLFLFLVAAQFLLVDAWWRVRRASPVRDVAAACRRLWIATEIVPAPVAIGVLITGLGLISDNPVVNRPSQPWLFALIAGFSFFFWDGIFGYQPIVRELYRHWTDAERRDISLADAAAGSKMGLRALALSAHAVSFPFVFLLGLLKPQFELPIGRSLANIDRAFSTLPMPWAQIAGALCIWLAAGAVIVSGRHAWRRFLP